MQVYIRQKKILSSILAFSLKEGPVRYAKVCNKSWVITHTKTYGTIHLRRQHVLGGEGCPHVPMVQRLQYIRIKNSLHKHFAGMPMVGGRGQKSWKFADVFNEWSLSYYFNESENTTYRAGIVDKVLKISAEFSALSNSSSYIFSNPMATWNSIFEPSNKNKSQILIINLTCNTLEYKVKNQLRVIKDNSISCS